MGPEGNILVNSSISTFQQGLTHSALRQLQARGITWLKLQDSNICDCPMDSVHICIYAHQKQKFLITFDFQIFRNKQFYGINQ